MSPKKTDGRSRGTWEDAQHHSLLDKRKSKLQWGITSQRSERASSKKSTKSKCQRWCGEKGTLLHGWWEYKLVQPLWKTVWRVLKKLKTQPLYIRPSNLTPGHIPRVNASFKKILHPQCSQQGYSQQPRHGSKPKWPPQINGKERSDPYLQWNMTQSWEGGESGHLQRRGWP